MDSADKNLGVLTKPENMIIEERSKNGNVIHRYVRGKFLGKVQLTLFQGGFAKCY
jgi:hypothetical protein